MGFWNSFWRETGKNTGKWASNKIFGSGWSTPYRFRHESYNTGSEDTYDTNSIDAESDRAIHQLLDNDRALNSIARNVTFENSNADEISNQLDTLLTSARGASNTSVGTGIFKTKIRSGIIRLRRLQEHELANFYQSELNKLNFSNYMQKIGFIVFGIICFGLLFFLAFKK